MVRVELTSYTAAKKLSTRLVCLLFLNRATRANTLCKAQKAKYSFKYTFRYLYECSVLLTPRPRPTDKSGTTIRYKTKLRCKSVVCIIICIYMHVHAHTHATLCVCVRARMHFLLLTWPPSLSLTAQSVNHLPEMERTQVWFLGREDPLEKEMATHSSILAWRSPWTEEPGSVQFVGSQESERT